MDPRDERVERLVRAAERLAECLPVYAGRPDTASAVVGLDDLRELADAARAVRGGGRGEGK